MRVLHMLHSLDVEPGNSGSTVRKGPKWSDAMGQDLALCVCTHRQTDTYACPEEDIQGHGKVFGVWYGKFVDIPARYLQIEHVVRSRQYIGLLDSMRKAYGDSFSEQDEVTVLLYNRIG